MAKRYKGTCSI